MLDFRYSLQHRKRTTFTQTKQVMKAGIIGSGAVGQTLAKAFQSEGYEVMLGTRDIAKPEVVQFGKDNLGIKAGTFKDVAIFGDLLVFAVSGDGAEEAIKESGIDNLSGKTIIDATNPISKEAPDKGVLKFFTDINFSLMEVLQQLAPEAKLVKAFNSVGNTLMYKPDFGDIKPTMFIAGNDSEAKQQVSEILNRFGWETEDMGGAEAARAIEPLAILWCIPGFTKNQWTGHAFKLLKK